MITKRTFLSLCLGLAAGALVAPGLGWSSEKLKIGILHSADEARYLQTAEGALKQLKAEGFDDGKISVDTQSAKGDRATAAKIAKHFVADGAKVILTMGTGATGVAVKEVKEIPIVFGMVWDPVDSGFAKDWRSSGTNTTGSSSKVPMIALYKTLKQLTPVKRLVVMFCPSEKNSVLQLQEFKDVQKELGIEIIEAPVAKAEEAASVARAFASRGEAIYTSGAVAVTSQMPAITAVLVERKIPTISHLADAVEAGALIGVTANIQEGAKFVGAKTAQILRGSQPADLPIEMSKRFDIAINLKTANAMGVKIPINLLQSASKIIR